MQVANGYPLEEYKVNTKDGWVLTLYRIPHGKNRHNTPGKRPVIYLHHGITLSSACFTLFNENESMAYILADAGFDVWLPNTRGNTFARGNYHHSHRDIEYWYHSMDEYALIDNPAMINKALEVSGAKKLAFVGHSQGCSVGYAMLASMPEMNEKISVMLQMGPVVFIDFFRAPFLRAMAGGRAVEFLRLAHSGEFLWYRFLAPFLPQCREYWWSEGCVAALNYMFYGPSSFISADDWTVILQTWPASVSSRNLNHWGQMMVTKELRFQRYDFGTNCSIAQPFEETCNQQKYGSLTPTEYDLSKVTAPVVIFVAEMDTMSAPEDVAEQRRRLRPGAIVTEIVYQPYGHMDFVWDRNARHMMDMVDIAYRYSPGTN